MARLEMTSETFRKIVNELTKFNIDLTKITLEDIERAQRLLQAVKDLNYFITPDYSKITLDDLEVIERLLYVERYNNMAVDYIMSHKNLQEINEFLERTTK